MWAMSPEESKALAERIDHLRKSKYVSDRIAAILMDSSVGGFGFDEDIAVAKAINIMDCIEFGTDRL